MKFKILILFPLILFLSGCFLLGGTPKKNPEQELYDEILSAFNSRAYESCIKACEKFLANYPKSKAKDAVMMRMGESFVGLLKRDYQELIAKGMEEKEARDYFLKKHSHYNCWEVQGENLVYNKEVFRRLLDENPKSHYADEAAYNLIPWESDYNENPELIEREIKGLQGVLTQYPTTSLRPRIYFEMGYRFHILYEIYSFSQLPAIKNQIKAKESYRQAEYLYNLCLSFPEETEFSQKALQYLDKLRQNSRIYIK